MTDELSDDTNVPGPDLADVRLPVVLVPTGAELVYQVRTLPIVTKCVALARWVDDVKELDEDGLLYPSDAEAAAAALDVLLDPGRPSSEPKLALPDVWSFAGLAGFLDRDFEYQDEYDDEGEQTGEREAELVFPTGMAQNWPEVDDDAILLGWRRTFATALTPPNVEDEPAAEEGGPLLQRLVQLGPVSAFTLLLDLYSGGSIELGPFCEALGDRVSRELLGGRAQGECHDLARGLLLATFGTLHHIGAARLDGETATLTPLGRWGLGQHLSTVGCHAPTVESVPAASAAELVELWAGAEAEQAESWLAEWLAERSEDVAGPELVEVARSAERRWRTAAFELLAGVGESAVPAVRDLLDEPELRPYALDWLRTFGHDDDRQLAMMPDDERRLFVDMVGAALEPGSKHLADLADPVAVARVEAVDVPFVEQLWRCDHPDTRAVLDFVGSAHPTKRIAKAARRAAFKLRSRPAA